MGGADAWSLPCSVVPRNHRNTEEGAGAGAGPALEDPLGTGPVTLREPEGSPQAFQSIELSGVSATQRATG